MKLLTSRPAITMSALLTLGIAAYLLYNVSTITQVERSMFGHVTLDARYLAGANLIAALVYVTHFRNDKARQLWLVLLTCTTFGRGLDLLLNGSPYLTRTQETKGFMLNTLLWGGGIVAAYLLSAYSWLYGPSGAMVHRHGEG